MNLGLNIVKEQFFPFSKNLCPLSVPIIRSTQINPDQIRADNVCLYYNIVRQILHGTLNSEFQTDWKVRISNVASGKSQICHWIQQVGWTLKHIVYMSFGLIFTTNVRIFYQYNFQAREVQSQQHDKQKYLTKMYFFEKDLKFLRIKKFRIHKKTNQMWNNNFYALTLFVLNFYCLFLL